MIGGFGAGGEINACIELGYDCVAFEKDKKQFDAVSAWLGEYDVWKEELDKKIGIRKANTERRAALAEEKVPVGETVVVCNVCGVISSVEFPDFRCVTCGLPVCQRHACSQPQDTEVLCTLCLPRSPSPASIEEPTPLTEIEGKVAEETAPFVKESQK